MKIILLWGVVGMLCYFKFLILKSLTNKNK
jgi:hypothetical protein